MKKKTVALCATVALAAVALGGATLAYFTDTESQTNTFTSGKVGIALDEAVVVDDGKGNLVAKKAKEEGDQVRTDKDQSYKLYPGMTVCKDPTITVDKGSENSYVAAKITVKGDLIDLYGADSSEPRTYYNLDITKFVSGGLIEEGSTQGWNWNGLSMIYADDAGNVYYQDASKGNEGENSEWVMYVFLKDVKKAGDEIVLFDKITVSSEYDNAEMAKLNGSAVEVEAFAVQTNGFTTDATDATDCFKAMTTAFPMQFPLGAQASA